MMLQEKYEVGFYKLKNSKKIIKQSHYQYLLRL